MSFRLKKCLVFGCVFLLLAFSFACKNEVLSDKVDFLSATASASLPSGMASLASLENLNLEDYEVKSALGPISTSEYPLDSKNFATNPEVFIQNFSLDSNPYTSPIESKGAINFNSSTSEDIWYIFTNTSGEDKILPKFNIPGGATMGSEVPEESETPGSGSSQTGTGDSGSGTTPGGGSEGSGSGSESGDSGSQGSGQGNSGEAGGVDIGEPAELPELPEVPDSEFFNYGPLNIDISKSIFDKGVGNSGRLHLYYYADYPSNWSLNAYVASYYHTTASQVGGYDEQYEKFRFHHNEAKNFVDRYKNYATIISKNSLSGENIATYVCTALGGFSPFFSVSVIAILASNYGTDELYPNQEITLKLNYNQFINMYYKRFDNPGFPELVCWEKELKDGSKNIGRQAINFKKQWYDERLHYKPYTAKSEFIHNVDNRIPPTYARTQKYWVTPEDEQPNPKHIYNYLSFNYYDYITENDHNAVYITDGNKGFGVYIPYFNWFYPIPATDGPQGKGYYVQGKLFKLVDQEFSIKSDEIDAPAPSRTVNFFNNLETSKFNEEKLKSGVLNRIAGGDLPEPFRLIPKSESLDTKGAGDNSTSPLGDYVGSDQTFVELFTSSGMSYYRNATCVLSRKVNTVFGDRTLVIYEENGLKKKPTSAEYEKIADAFLQAGSNNDIYDKITNIYGSEWGYYNQTFLKSIANNKNVYIPLVKKSNTITLFYTDLGNVGDGNEYISAAYLPNDLELNSSNRSSNERMMIHVHAPKATGDYFAESLISIAREFEKIIHDQYFSKDLNNYCYSEQVTKFGAERPSDESGFSDYFFSFIAKVIAANSLRDKGYSIPSSYNLYSLADTNFTDLFGLDKYYLYGMDKFDLGNMILAAQEGDDYQSIAKAVISSFAYYIYTNFGSGFIQKYTLGSKAGLEGIVDAINRTYGANFTLSELLASWAVATLTSDEPSLNRPHTFNYVNRFKVQGVDYPNINFANTKSFKSSYYGVPSSTSQKIVNNSSACYKVVSSWRGEYNMTAPVLQDGLALRIVRKASK